jgi:hypothetical protein
MKTEFITEKPVAEVEFGECFKWANNLYMKGFLMERMAEQLAKDEVLFNRGKHCIIIDLEYGDVSVMQDDVQVYPLNMKVVPR